jgi:PPOX class probable F420-dependent enzyme
MGAIKGHKSMTWIPEEYLDLLKDETKAFGTLATLMNDGSPQVTPIWFDTDGSYILINSAEGRIKDRNMRRDTRVAFAIIDPKNPYRYIQIRGRVVEITTEGARDHIDRLAKKYTGADRYTSFSPNEIRVTYKILPENLHQK